MKLIESENPETDYLFDLETLLPKTPAPEFVEPEIQPSYVFEAAPAPPKQRKLSTREIIRAKRL